MNLEEHLEELYLRRHLTMSEIGRMYNLTRQSIFLYIKKAGMDTSQAERFKISCDKCNKAFEITRKRWRKQSTHYCSIECYLSDRKNINYKPHRNGQREARMVMAKHIGRQLTTDEIVHHIDGNCTNNHIDNLILFPSHGAHMRQHHQQRIGKHGN